MNVQPLVINAAGGNATAIRVLERRLSRAEYESQGRMLRDETESFGVEQQGFLIVSEDHFEMSGGEFCGNASRAAAVLFSQLKRKPDARFTVSGFDGNVDAKVVSKGQGRFFASCRFPGLPLTVQDVQLANGQSAKVVDLKGIVHVVIEAPFPECRADYERAHRSIAQELEIESRDAVGVIWFERTSDGIMMHPVVWVGNAGTFYYETSCGSGAIAVSKVTGAASIQQPTGKIIEVQIDAGTVTVSSEMEIEREFIFADQASPERYRHGFVSTYSEAFGGPPYYEQHDDDEILKSVWNPHLRDGIIALCLNAGHVVGFGCAIPVLRTPDESVQKFLHDRQLAFPLSAAWYMSEIGVRGECRRQGIGLELIKRRLLRIQELGYNYYIMRTALEGSNSLELYRSIGAQEIGVQELGDIGQFGGSQSKQRIYLYGDCLSALQQSERL